MEYMDIKKCKSYICLTEEFNKCVSLKFTKGKIYKCSRNGCLVSDYGHECSCFHEGMFRVALKSDVKIAKRNNGVVPSLWFDILKQNGLNNFTNLHNTF